MENGRHKRLEPYVGAVVSDETLEAHGFEHFLFGKRFPDREDDPNDEDEMEAVQDFFGEDCWMKYVPFSDRDLNGNDLDDAAFMLGITKDQDDVITSVREYCRIGIPFGGGMPVIPGLPVPLYYQYMQIDYAPRYLVKEMEELRKEMSQ
ncbi:MAG: hypothetical protein VZR02_06560 [Lachnospiraceae bacterium]|nr:hypothetical protein [Lachnospiraceae bacterium]